MVVLLVHLDFFERSLLKGLDKSRSVFKVDAKII
jgi:hypothetical protein